LAAVASIYTPATPAGADRIRSLVKAAKARRVTPVLGAQPRSRISSVERPRYLPAATQYSASSTLDFGNWPIVAVRQLIVPAAVVVLI